MNSSGAGADGREGNGNGSFARRPGVVGVGWGGGGVALIITTGS